MVIERVDKYYGLGGIEGSALGSRNVTARLDSMNRLRRLKGGRLLDIGCGNGAYTIAMADGFTDVVGIDIEPDRLDLFRAAPGHTIEVHHMSADSTSFEDGSFDAVTAIETIEHVDDPSAVAREVRRVLKPGGVFYLTTPNRWWPFEQHGWRAGNYQVSGWTFPMLTWFRPLHRRFSNARTFTPRELDEAILHHGFRRIGHDYMYPPMDRSRLRPLLDPIFAALSKLAPPLGQTIVTAYEAT